jgi:hypothetical protein
MVKLSKGIGFVEFDFGDEGSPKVRNVDALMAQMLLNESKDRLGDSPQSVQIQEMIRLASDLTGEPIAEWTVERVVMFWDQIFLATKTEKKAEPESGTPA